MRVRLQVGDQASQSSAVSYYRMAQPARVARELGVDIDMQAGLDITRISEKGPGGLPLLRTYVHAFEADVIVLQRPAERSHVEYIPIFQKQGIAVVVELDDDLSAHDTRHIGWRAFDPKLSPDHNWRHLQRCCQMADMVTCSTPALAERFAPHGRFRVLRNCVPQAMLDMAPVERADDVPAVGWSGWTVTHPGDLAVTRGGVAQAVRDTGARFLVIGSAEGVKDQLNLDVEPLATGFIVDDMPRWQRALGALDVGIVPLAPGRFNEAKSTLKGLEYASRGVPFVASPTAEYMRLESEGAGITVTDRGRKWRSFVKLLLNPGLNAEYAEAGREVVARRYTYEDAGEDWVDAWEAAVVNRRQASRIAA